MSGGRVDFGDDESFVPVIAREMRLIFRSRLR